MLGLPGKSMIAPLYTETGLTPLRMRRLVLTLGYAKYLISLKHNHYAGAAFRDSLGLARNGKKSWAKDMQKAIQKMPFPVPVIPLVDPSMEDIDEIIDQVLKETETWMQKKVDESVKLYLIHGRVEPDKEKPPAPKVMHMRHYLYLVRAAKHRRALTSIIVGSHMLAIERMRWTDKNHKKVHDRTQRKCRLCHSMIETPEHALLECVGVPELIRLRNIFISEIFAEIPGLGAMAGCTPTEFLKALIYERKTIALTAKFVYEILEVFYAHKLIWPRDSDRTPQRNR
ncbi:hypothetical protein C8J56DRAFT_805934 [Mycena floridula]|nr:hypothetical protein C8J56DRAFT_805934 [Mycena floridula]